MKYIILLNLLIVAVLPVLSQKRLIEKNVFDKWPNVQKPNISSNGKYVTYMIDKMPLGSHTLVIQAIDKRWKKEIVAASEGQFTYDGKKVVYKLNVDSLCVLNLGTDRLITYGKVQDFRLLRLQSREFLLLRFASNAKELRLLDLTGKQSETIFRDVINYTVSEDGKAMLLQIAEKSEMKNRYFIKSINVEKGTSCTVWTSGNNSAEFCGVSNIIFDTNRDQIAFIVSKHKGKIEERSLWYWKHGMQSAEEMLNGQSPSLPEQCVIADGKFSKDGGCLFFDLRKFPNSSMEDLGVMVDIWSYTDDNLQSQQLKKITEPLSYTGVINLSNKRVNILQSDNEKLDDIRFGSDNYILLSTTPCFSEESNWRNSCRVPLYLVNIMDGTRRLIKDSLLYSDLHGFSPDRKHVVYYDYEKYAYFSYDITTGQTHNITQKIPFSIFDTEHERGGFPKPFTQVPNKWLPPNNSLIIYDKYDIWQVDPTNINPPVCLTNGYGRKNGVILRLTQEGGLITEQEILLLAFRPSDKYNGFYRLNLTTLLQPEILTMGPYLYNWPKITGISPLKAANAKTWLVQRMNFSEAPNYFVTKDFKRFTPLSNVHPHKEYNWIKAELHEWTTLNGTKLQGILYMPEDFDPRKKYPLIFNFYERSSDRLNLYIPPEPVDGPLNIPLFVSNGYLVFVPDICYKIGEPAQCIYDAVISAAKYICKMPFVDSTKLGLQGHSWGGYEVNVMITKTNLFAAAAEAAGPTDFVSGYGSVLKAGYSNQFQYETGQSRMGGTLWQNKDSYIKNSPIFYADKVKTPLLIMHCKADAAVPFEQGVEWFTALRRLGNPVWMLQYDFGDHQLAGLEAEDFTIRLMQFFDHYLKSKPAPKWMIHGVPARFKGIKPG